jgi:DNA-binding NarL/FixJ family response regulator
MKMIEADSRTLARSMATDESVPQAERPKTSASRRSLADGAVKIFLVEDHAWFRSQLAALITVDPRLVICGEADNAAEALAAIMPASPDLVIIDITLKGMNGLDLIRELRARSCNAFMLVLSMHDESMYAERALRAGANGYIAKHETSKQLREAIQRVLAGSVYLSRRMTTEVLQKMASAEDDAVPARKGFASLSPREREIFQYIGRGLTTREIARELDLGDKTVHSHRHQIKLKLGIRHGGELYIQAAGWLEEQKMSSQVGIAPAPDLLQDASVHDKSCASA